ncbi:DNA-binding protein H-NS [Caballeronia arationis]|jgi:DNA-binding protein H-NS|uniref:DNA-binding protein H-NS n=1 Tax=Caballeronia arationis TaxID=1777142 RepID=A0A7Z7I1C1_9BURK|nr:H-NS histone family protein [Caballeronia arationis]SOE48345.1 DNA-binding protein H-NS [Caballeronia arationis]SOE91340.1 DNA-binding protein H-NS [Caballeronia arationis]
MEIKQPSLKELLAQRQTLQQQVAAARQREADVVLADIVRKMHEYQISLADLMGRDHESQNVTAAAVPKYRDLQSGATWSGRGRAPHWIVDKNRDDFLVRA